MKQHSRCVLPLPRPNQPGKPGVVLRPGQRLRLPFALAQTPYPTRHRLRVVGETDLFWRWKTEGGMPMPVFRSIADALVEGDDVAEKYALHLAGRGETWPRHAHVRVRLDHHGRAAAMTFAVACRTRGLRIARGGAVGVELGVYRRRPGRHPDDVLDPPDLRFHLSVPAGTRPARELVRRVRLPGDAVTLLVRVGGARFAGDVWFGTPRLFVAGADTLIPPFAPENPHWTEMNWLGENLSRKEWPEFTVALDGRRVFAGPVFNSIHRRAEFEVPLPRLRPGRHRLELQLVADYPTALPFLVQSVEILGESARPVEVIAHPEYAREHARFPVLLERNGGTRARLEVVTVPAGPARAHPRFEITVGRERFALGIRRVVRRDDDPIAFSAGDALYIPQTPAEFTRYLCWYLANRLGNTVGFRPVYRWSGSRELNPAAWKTAVDLLNRLGLRYFLMMDGRELPGQSANPPASLLRGPGFMGVQAHELDGIFNYAGPYEDNGLFSDLFRRRDPVCRQPVLRALRRHGNNVVGGYDRLAARTMKEAAELFVRCAAAARGSCTRHTGPSTLFRYFLRAGYDWVGAEQMYGPEEITLASLRGACRAAGRKSFGAHLAMQWSSGPQSAPAHARRYFLSLATAYLQGADQINLEDGLWRMEADYAGHDRFSRAARLHRDVHQRFFRFLQTHPRRGALQVPVALLQGRHCGWRCFARGGWGSDRPEFQFGPPEESFDLLNVFYPRSVLDAIYRFPCADRPQGWYSGTPFGPVDLLPVEAPAEVLGAYQGVAFLGWNTFADEDFRKLLAWMETGGTLLLARPHVAVNEEPGRPAVLPNSRLLRRLLGSRFDRARQPIRRRVGRGRVIFFPGDRYPSHPQIRLAYERELRAIGEAGVHAERRRGWVRGSRDVNFAAYDHADGRRTIYLLNIDWWSGRAARPATLLVGPREFTIPVRAGRIESVTVSDRYAFWPESEDTDILEVREEYTRTVVQVQSDRAGRLRVFPIHAPGPPRWLRIPRGGVSEIVV